MKKNWLRIVGLLIVTFGLCSAPAVAAAQSADAAPKIAMVISLQQDTLRIDDQAQGVLEIANQSDVAADDARFEAALPDFLVLHAGTCAGQPLAAALDLGPLPAHAVKTQPFCINLNPNTARAGSFNLLFKITYTWNQKTDLTAVEKTVQVDLIGNQTILGLPLAFAGFILPGLMFLIAVRWFKVPWAVGLSGEDKLVYSVLLSLLLVGPFAWLGSRPGAPALVQLLSFSQQVTIERLAAYLVIGFVFGLITGWAFEKYRSDQERKIKALELSIHDDPRTIIQKALLLNPDYHGGQVSFSHKQKGSLIQGAHYVEAGSKLYIFSEFRLNGSQLDGHTQGQVKKLIGSAANFGTDGKLILSVLSLIPHPSKDLIQVSNPVLEIGADNVAKPGDPDLAFVELDRADYSAPTIKRTDDTVLLDVQF